MRACGYCKFLDKEKRACKRGYDIQAFEKLAGFKRPKECTKKLESVKLKKRDSNSWLNKQLDKQWGIAVRRAGYCALCLKKPPEVILHAHHIFSRRHYGTRWLLDNGICLCTHCHLYVAHKDIQEFADFIRARVGDEKLGELRALAHSIADFSKDEKRLLLDRFLRAAGH